MEKTKVILIASLKNGAYLAEYFLNEKNTQLLKCYTLNDEKGKDISDYISFDEIFKTRENTHLLTKVDNINNYENEIKDLNADYIFVVGWQQLVSSKIISSVKKGVIGFHPSKLPANRGRSVLAWQISEGYKKGCVSMFFIDEGIDSGDVIAMEKYKISYNDTIRDVLNNVYEICLNLTKTYYPLLIKGLITPVKQNPSKATYRRLRTFNDGIINFNETSYKIYNLIRALTKPYPCAVMFLGDEAIHVLSAEETEIHSDYLHCENGTIVELKYQKGIVVKVKDGGILIKDIIIDEKEINSANSNKFSLGDILK